VTRAAALLLSLSIALATPYAFADSYDAAMARAAAAKEKALDANDAASWEEALARFLEADALRETKESKYEVATAAAWVKQDDLAVEAYAAALSLGIADPAKGKAEAFVAERASKMGKLRVVGPAGARVLIDGRPRGTLPRSTPFVVFAGSVKVRVEGGAVREGTVEARAGEESTFDATPVVQPPPPPPPRPIAPPPVKDSPERPRSNTLGWSLLIGGGGVAVLGLGTTLLAMSRVSHYQGEVEKYCSSFDGTYCATVRSEGEKAAAQDASDGVATWRAIRTSGIVTSIVGGAVAIAGGVLLFSGKSSEGTTTALRANLAGMPGGGFLSLSGTF